MGRNTLIGAIAGGVIVFSTFFDSWGWGISWPLSGGFSFTLFLTGVAIAVLSLMGKRLWAQYATVAAATLVIAEIFNTLFSLPFVDVRLQMTFALVGAAGAVYAHFIAKQDKAAF